MSFWQSKADGRDGDSEAVARRKRKGEKEMRKRLKGIAASGV